MYLKLILLHNLPSKSDQHSFFQSAGLCYLPHPFSVQILLLSDKGLIVFAWFFEDIQPPPLLLCPCPQISSSTKLSDSCSTYDGLIHHVMTDPSTNLLSMSQVLLKQVDGDFVFL